MDYTISMLEDLKEEIEEMKLDQKDKIYLQVKLDAIIHQLEINNM